VSKILKVKARQVFDSRGNPTVEAEVYTKNNSATAICPSGASTGTYEAYEKRDKKNNRYLGKSVFSAVNLVNSKISKKLKGQSIHNQERIDALLINLDGTRQKTNLGANAMLAVSMAVKKLSAKVKKLPLYKTFSVKNNFQLPYPLMNIINGGAHANNDLDFQEFMILPVGFDSFSDSLRAGVEIFHTLKNNLNKKSLATSVGDEGGFAPNISSNNEALEVILDSIEKAGYKSGEEVYLGLDVASSEFYKDDSYMMSDGSSYDSKGFCTYLESLCNDYPIISIEDGMSENDWDGWKILTDKLDKKIQLVGDDVFVTNQKIFKTGIDKSC